MSEDLSTITVPNWLLKKIEERLPRTEFKSVSEYATYVLTQLVADEKKEYNFSEEEEEKVKDRLRALGYL